MEKAHSIYYGKVYTAEEIAPLENARQLYKDLGLQCPVCGSSVTLAIGEVRKPYFRHPPEANPKPCEQRAKSMTPQEWEKLQRKLDQQRSKFFQQHFWQILTGSASLMHLDEFEAAVVEGETAAECTQIFDEWVAGVRRHRENVLTMSELMVHAIANKAVHYDPKLQPDMDNAFQLIQQDSQKRSIVAAFDYLLSRSGLSRLKVLVMYGFYDYLGYSEENPVQYPPMRYSLDRFRIYPFALSDVLGFLIAVDWAGAADDLKKYGSVQPKRQFRSRNRLEGAITEANFWKEEFEAARKKEQMTASVMISQLKKGKHGRL